MKNTAHRQALPKGCQLKEFRIESILGHGGFGITYLALDMNLNNYVALKEYLPSEIAMRERENTVVPKTAGDNADFEWGLDRFIKEARKLGKLARFRHPNILRVTRIFEAYGTAYMVTDYEHGKTMSAYLKKLAKKPSEAELRQILMPLLDALETVHQAKIMHLDIKPDNIYICMNKENQLERPVLIDFGSSRQSLSRRSRSMATVVAGGYSPPEQYSSDASSLGPWSDIYAMAAVMHRAITGTLPPDSPLRIGAVMNGKPDPLPQLIGIAPKKYSFEFLNAIDQGLAIRVDERPQSVTQWRKMFEKQKPKPEPELNRKPLSPLKSVNWMKQLPLLLLLIAGILIFAIFWLNFGALTVQTIPDGAAIFINGEKIGKAPVTLNKQNPGDIEVRAELPGYQTIQKTVKIVADEETKVTFKLLVSTGKLVVKSDPDNAKWWLNDQYIGLTSIQKNDLEQGKYNITVKKEGYLDWNSKINIIAGETSKAEAKLEPGDWTEPLTNIKFVWVKSGCFYMGQSRGDQKQVKKTGGFEDELPRHKVCLQGFWMGKYEISNRQYRMFKPDHDSGLWKKHTLNKDNQPAVKVSWKNAVSYAKWLSDETGKPFRLPFEAEWEYAARAGTQTVWFWGDFANKACSYANVYDRALKKMMDRAKIAFKKGGTYHKCNDKHIVSAPIGSFKPNPFGLHDMLGNVWEWCDDWYNKNYYKKRRNLNPEGPSSGSKRVFRGGCWSNSAEFVRAAYRHRGKPDDSNRYNLGFRLLLPSQ